MCITTRCIYQQLAGIECGLEVGGRTLDIRTGPRQTPGRCAGRGSNRWTPGGQWCTEDLQRRAPVLRTPNGADLPGASATRPTGRDLSSIRATHFKLYNKSTSHDMNVFKYNVER